MRLILCFCFLIFFSANSFATSLQEAISTAFEKNPITHANDLRLEAAKYRAKGVNKERLPETSINCYRASEDLHLKLNGTAGPYDVRDRGCSFDINATLFDGFAGKNEAIAAQREVEALAARNNSTNALIENTKGSVANQVFDIYVWIVENAAYTEYNKLRKIRLEALLKVAKTEEQKNEIKAKLANNSNGAFNLKQSYQRASAAYLQVVKIPIPSKVDNFKELAESLEIPRNPDEAIELALLKSPDIVEDQKSLEAAQYRRKSEMARMFAPKVNMNVGYGNTMYEETGYFSKSKGVSTSLSVQVPLGLSKRDYAKASALEVLAKEKDLDQTLSLIEYKIRDELYFNFAGYIELSERLKRSMDKTNEDVEEVIKKAQAGQSVDIRYALSIMEEYGSQVDQYIFNEKQLVTSKFTIQRTIGTLFDKIKERF